MADETKLVGQAREVSGSGAAGRLRRNGWLPCVIYSAKGKTRMIQVPAHDLELMLQHHRGESMMVDLELDGKKPRTVLLKDVQHDAVTDKPLHADFLEVSMTEKMRVSVPLVCVGECVGVTQDGGVLDHTLRDVEVECLPANLPESIEVDVSALHLGHSIAVGEVPLPDGVSLAGDGELAVVSVHAQRVVEEPTAEEAEEAEEGAEPEVVGAKEEGAEEEESSGEASS